MIEDLKDRTGTDAALKLLNDIAEEESAKNRRHCHVHHNDRFVAFVDAKTRAWVQDYANRVELKIPEDHTERDREMIIVWAEYADPARCAYTVLGDEDGGHDPDGDCLEVVFAHSVEWMTDAEERHVEDRLSVCPGFGEVGLLYTPEDGNMAARLLAVSGTAGLGHWKGGKISRDFIWERDADDNIVSKRA